ncbi:peptidoglycan glycosyltransferase [Breznakia sp. PF5-3]|uniref:penicillin-binding transpeptidase domain-containing protein n=1 Tax=unclassified Breznakia TaxID=2623764 RepID=UPI002406034E|nr:MULTISPECIES: penicillin-binding transpeptidase domain-containing protein [unclassified Breznakia]MDF9825884.1 peptidoglycan glycosyltransferase [Breznakia sp. PM6-1]MDF9836683.1 peptidoglycan glycosyltransferase [Breznakia sp. PF5-3]MDF9838957.1 peptidoglycan glycosyltransferase [Breznakia sp. PFB2-8]MDF9860978.1 peptidoglycan glycosyltransferase [Breznakia sp. PH5-24]
MNRVAKRARYLSILIVVFSLCAIVFFYDYFTSASTWVVHPSNANIYHDGELTVAGNVYSSDKVKLLQSDNNGLTYADDFFTRLSTLHVVGDKDDNITTGVLTSKRDKLIGYDLLNGLFGAADSDHTIHLTINAELSALAYQALGEQNGAIGIYNYETGEVLCMVSKPSYDPYDPPSAADAVDGVYINRVMNGVFVPGSIMKLVTSYAAIENISDIYEQTFDCHQGVEIDGQWIECNGYHGTQTFEQALANSCNAAFARIAIQVGNDTLEEYAKKVGITSTYTIDGVRTSAGRFNVADADNVNLAWAGIGQYTTMVDPMQYMMFCGAIANGGVMKKPYYIEEGSFLSSINISDDGERIMEEDVANQLKELMRNNTISNYGEWNFPDLEVGAKSGTAEVEEGDPHSWFVGFSNAEQTPLAFVVIVENDGGVSSSINVASTVLQRAASIMDK